VRTVEALVFGRIRLHRLTLGGIVNVLGRVSDCSRFFVGKTGKPSQLIDGVIVEIDLHDLLSFEPGLEVLN
jgi:hypothetical protein